MDIASLSAKLSIDDAAFRRSLSEDKALWQQLGRVAVDQGELMNRAARESMAAWNAETQAATRSLPVQRQSLALSQELTSAKARLGEALAGEGRIAQEVAARYPALLNAERAQLIEVKQQIAAQEALQKSLLEAAAAAEKAAATEAAASAKAASAAEAGAVKQAAAAQKNLGRSLTRAGGALTSAVTTPILAVGGAAIASALDVQGGANQIAASTGAQGAQLQALEAIYKRVAVTVPQSFKEVGQAVGDLFARTHLAGQALTDLATTELDLSRITGGALTDTITKTTQVFDAWHITVADQIPTLDKLEKAHQTTGINVIALSNTLSRSAATFQAWGLSLNDSIGLLANFQKANIEPARALTGLTTGIGKLAKAGVTDLHAAFRQIIKDLSDTEHPSTVFKEAVNLFGTRTGPQFVKAVQDGSLSLKDFEKVLDGSRGAIAKTAEATQTFVTRFKTELKAAEIALEPLGVELLKVAAQLLQALKPAIDFVARLTDAFSHLSPGARQAVIDFALFAAAIGPVGKAIGGLITGFGFIKGAWLTVATFLKGSQGFAAITVGLEGLGGSATAVAGVWGLAFAGMTGAVYLLLGKLEEAFPKLRQLAADTGNLLTPRKPERFGPLPPGSLSQSAGGGDLGAAYKPLFADAPGAPAGPGAALQSAADRARLRGVETGKKPLDAAAAAARHLADTLDQAREAALRTQAALHFGELSKEVVAVDLFGQSFGSLSEAHRKAAVQLLGYRQQEDAAKQAMEATRAAAEARRQAQEKLTQAVADSRIEFLKAQAVSRFGELSQEAAALDLLNIQWKNLDRNQRQVVLSALDFKTRAKAISDETAATDALDKSVQDLNLKLLSLTSPSAVERFAAANLGINYGAATDDQQRLARRAFTQQGNIDRETGAGEARAAAQTAYVEYRKSQAKSAFGENSLQYIALDQFKHAWENLTDAEKAATREILHYHLAAGGLADTGADQLFGRLAAAFKAAGEEHAKLIGQSRELTIAQELLNAAWAAGDADLLEYALLLEAAAKDNDALKIAQEAAAKTTEAQAAAFQHLFQQLDAHQQVIRDLDLTYQKLIHGSLRDQIALNSEYKTTYAKLSTAAKQWVDAQVKGIEKIQQETTKLDFFKKLADGTQQVFQNVFQNLFEHGFKGFFANVRQGFTQLFQQIAAEYLSSQLVKLLLNSFGGGGGGGSAASLSQAVFGRASGGPVEAGQLYRINEGAGQQEYFLPRTSGTILPNAAAAGAGGATYHFTFNVSTPDANSFRKSQSQLLSDAHAHAERARRRGS